MKNPGWKKLWIGGLIILLAGTSALVLITQLSINPGWETHLTFGAPVDQLITDPSGHVWAQKGSAMLDVETGKTITFPTSFSLRLAVFDRQGRLWGSDNSDIFILDPSTGWQTIKPRSVMCARCNMDALVFDAQGTAWLLVDKELARIDPVSFEITKEVEKGVRAISVDPAGRLWILETGGVRMRQDDGSWKTITEQSDISSRVPYMQFDQQNRLWVIFDGFSRSGLSMLEANGEWQDIYSKDPNFGWGHIVIDPRGRIWSWNIIFPHGAFVFDPASGEWANFTRANSGIPSDKISSIAIDAQGRVWLAFHESFPGLNTLSVMNSSAVSLAGPGKSYPVSLLGRAGQGFYWMTIGWLLLGGLARLFARARQAHKFGQIGLGFLIFCGVQLLLLAGINSRLGPELDFAWIVIVPGANIIALALTLFQSGKSKWISSGYLLPVMAVMVYAASLVAALLFG